jgi:hypothetical protein
MHMGNLKGQRYSSLTQITKANVGTLKQAWKINLGYCTTKNAACGSNEANAVVAGGTYYFQDPFGSVYALDGATGARLWKWTPTTRRASASAPLCKPGVAIGEEQVFAVADGQPMAQPDNGCASGRQVTPWRTGGGPQRSDLRQRHVPGIRRRQRRSGAPCRLHGQQRRRVWSWADPVGQPATRRGRRTRRHTTTARMAAARWGSAHRREAQPGDLRDGQPVPWNSRGKGENLTPTRSWR